MFGRGNHHRVNVLERQQLLRMLKSPRRLAVVFLIGRHGAVEVVSPHVADRRYLDVFLIFQKRHNPIEFRTAVSDSDVSERDPIIRPDDAGVRKRRTAHSRASCGHGRAFLQKLSPVNLAV